MLQLVLPRWSGSVSILATVCPMDKAVEKVLASLGPEVIYCSRVQGTLEWESQPGAHQCFKGHMKPLKLWVRL